MMDSWTADRSLLPCQTWTDRSTALSLNQRLGVGSSSGRRSGALTSSVPDAAALRSKQPPQGGNVPNASAQDANDGRRSSLLQQRAKLLEQLQIMDKLLEAIPPDDSHEDQFSHTAVQPRSAAGRQMSEDPEERPSPAESPHQDDSCYDSEDAGPQSEVTVASSVSDGNGCSRPPSPTGPPRKRTRDPSGEGESGTPPPGDVCQTGPGKPPETAVLPVSKTKAKRVYGRRNYCLFCSKPVCKMARHLERVHSDRAEVAVTFQYPIFSKERQKIWNKLTNEGNFAHNKDVLRTGRGQLAVRKRPAKTLRAEDFVHCVYCHGLYGKRALHRHLSRCPHRAEADGGQGEESGRGGRRSVISRCVLLTVDFSDPGISESVRSVLSEMVYDEVTRVVMSNRVILQFGEQMLTEHSGGKHGYVRQNLRQVARLLLEAQRTTPMTSLEDFFCPSNFPHVVSAVNALAGFNPGSRAYGAPSLAVKLGYSLQKICGIVEQNATETGDGEAAENARGFLSVYQQEWNRLVSSEALTGLREMKREKERRAPLARDVRLLLLHLEAVQQQAEQQLRESLSAQSQSLSTQSLSAQSLSAQSLSAQSQSLSAQSQSLSAQSQSLSGQSQSQSQSLSAQSQSLSAQSLGAQSLSAQSQSLSAQSQSLGAQSLSAQSLSAQSQSLSAQSLSAQSLSAQSLSAQSLSAQSLSAQSLSAQSLSAQSQSLSAQSLSAQSQSLSAQSQSLGAQSLSAQSLSAQSQSLSAQSLSAQSLSAQSLSAQSLSAQSLSAQSLSAQSLSAQSQSLSAQSLSAQSLSAQSLSAQSLSAQSLSAQSQSLGAQSLSAQSQSLSAQSLQSLSAQSLSAQSQSLGAQSLSAQSQSLGAQSQSLSAQSLQSLSAQSLSAQSQSLGAQSQSLGAQSQSQSQSLSAQSLSAQSLSAQSLSAQSLGAQRYAALARVALARVILFNRRRSKEVASIPVEAFASRKRPQADALEDLDPSVSGLERTLCGFFPRVEVRGSSGRMLPVLLRPCLESSLELLVGSRAACGVSRGNPFVFGRPGAPSAYSGSACVQMFVSQCGAERPAGLTAVSIRRHYAAAAQLLQLDEGEAARIFGPDHQIHVLRQDAMSDDAHAQSLVRLKLEEGQHGSYGETAHTSDSLRKRDSHQRAKLKWEEEEVRAVERHLMRLIREGRVPQKSDCVRCLEAEPRALRTRSWRGIKDYVRNRITTLQRQEGSLRKPSNGSKRQEEPQQRTESSKVKLKWEEEEVRAVGRHLMSYIEEQEVPPKSDCVRCLEAEPRALRTRSWRGIKDYVRNRITTLQRQEGSLRNPSNGSKRPRTEESQQRTDSTKAKLKWDPEEVRAVEGHLAGFIQEGRVPQKSDCVRCLEAEPRALRTRSWRGIKDYVRNRITTLQRQRGSASKSCSPEEQPQSARTYQQL